MSHDQFVYTEHGVASAIAAYQELVAHLESLAPGIDATLRSHEEYWALIGPEGTNAFLSFFTWRPNSLEDAQLHIGIYDGLPDVPGFDGLYGLGRQLRNFRFEYALRASGRGVWYSMDGEVRDFSSGELAEVVARAIVSTSDRDQTSNQ